MKHSREDCSDTATAPPLMRDLLAGFDASDGPEFNLHGKLARQRGAEMSMHLAEIARQIRNQTVVQLKAAPESWLLWAPPSTSNHILWHAGHALWVQDALSVAPLTGASELPSGWELLFGADCRPVRETQHWPERREVLRLLESQLVRLQELFRERAEQLTDSALAAEIVHGLHDEARHQGEMFLLFKLRRAQGD